MAETPGFIVYADGSCWTGDRIGAYAWVVLDEDDNIVLEGGEYHNDTTISRMELKGPIEALAHIQSNYGPAVVLVYSDSLYVVMGAMNRSRQRKKNVDLWDELDENMSDHELVAFEHVKGHDGNEFNEQCDQIAGGLRKQGQLAVSTT